MVAELQAEWEAAYAGAQALLQRRGLPPLPAEMTATAPVGAGAGGAALLREACVHARVAGSFGSQYRSHVGLEVVQGEMIEELCEVREGDWATSVR